MSKIGDKGICEYDGYEWHPVVDENDEIIKKIHCVDELMRILKISESSNLTCLHRHKVRFVIL